MSGDNDYIKILILITCLCTIYMFYSIVAQADGDTVMWCMGCSLTFVVLAVFNNNLIISNE